VIWRKLRSLLLQVGVQADASQGLWSTNRNRLWDGYLVWHTAMQCNFKSHSRQPQSFAHCLSRFLSFELLPDAEPHDQTPLRTYHQVYEISKLPGRTWHPLHLTLSVASQRGRHPVRASPELCQPPSTLRGADPAAQKDVSRSTIG